jgi:type 1 glutamine amidotransferase
MKVLLVSGGRGHPAASTAPVLAPILGDDVDIVDLTQGLAELREPRHDLLVVNALAHTMHDARYSDADRAEWAFHLDDPSRNAIEKWLGHGRPLLALHTALVSFDDWPAWHGIVGGTWEWGRSWHDAPGRFTVVPCVAGLAPFEVEDECYSDLRIDDDVEVVARAGAAPVAWRHVVGAARVAACTLGHDATSFATPGHADLLRAMVAWLVDEEGTCGG